MNRYITLLLILFHFTAMFAEKVPTDTILSRYFSRAASLMSIGKYSEAQETFDSAFSTKGVKESYVYPILLNEQATLLVYIGKIEEAFEMKKNVLNYIGRIDNLETKISVYNDLAIMYRQRHVNDSTIYYYNKALNTALQYKDNSWITHIYNNISVYYFNIRQLEEAEKYNEMATRYATETDDMFVKFSYWQFRSAIKSELNKLDEAEASIRKAWEIACNDKDNSVNLKMRCMPSIIRVFEKTEQPDSVEYYLNMGDRLLEEMSVTSIPAIGYIQVRASAEMNRNNYLKALDDFLWLRKRDIGSEPKTLLFQIARCYDALGKEKLAYQYMDSARMWTDTLAQHNLTKQMAEFNVKYQTQEKELQIARLQQDQLKHQTLILKTIISAGCLLAVCIILVLFFFYKKRIAEKKVTLLKQENELNSARRYIEGLEEECKYFAKELHDGIANDLLGLQMKIECTDSGKDIAEIGEYIGQLRNNVRNISHELMPPEFGKLALNEILDHYSKNMNKSTGIDIEFIHSDNKDYRLIPDEVAYEVYRITQEVTMNIVKHTSVSRIVLELITGDCIQYTLKISGYGKVRTNDKPVYNDGIGLRTVKDRAKSINAETENIISDEQQTFILKFSIQTDNR